MDTAIITAIIVGIFSVFGTFLNSKYTSNVQVARLEVEVTTLKREVREHNSVIERTYKLEEKVGILEHDIQGMR